MATAGEWIEGARPRTLPNAVAPVVAGVGAAIALDGFSWPRSILALLVSLSLIVGVNYANDYSDGIRGTDENRVGPLRLVGSGVAKPKAVLTAALVALGLAGVLGLVLVAISGLWWLLAMGAVCILGAWFYTGGKKPYGYYGFGEIAVFVFFGLAGVLGTVYVQAGQLSWAALGCAVAVGSFSTGVLTANNLRDIPTDIESGKRTLATRLGDGGTRRLYLTLVAVPYVVSVLLAFVTPWALLGLVTAPLLLKSVKAVGGGAQGRALIPALRDTGFAMLGWAVLSAVALAL
ncbi:1,4-dihydroxy-2-naphthoate polyprenyltransferase [Amycolatopsis keratiniphila]|uniref:1,4-dihydroxy-2-naphthoate polyprenyltransferase n=1 Tax=Amycolatopsis keratiniphila TaxID=129921 RepID=UPI00087989A3|nr:1,4-dihydroxy-2-naphthoate polyprenyltransferase [Amycolatopsis keratiniphila]OLZ56191.1 1,4-dihydroxy-2-naphthoate polyprenyltransferase [Amycolatopsis keratiniphila subsp. nogabecina]SDU52408.1 1,4-dihydroxy-2-naphthoate prenyltransferase [Amycolatopsis keratiniphila]